MTGPGRAESGMSEVSDETLAGLAALAEAAHREVVRLCTPGSTWRMSIPANPTWDSDLIIDDALSHIAALVAEVQRHRVVMAEVEALAVQLVATCEPYCNPSNCDLCDAAREVQDILTAARTEAT